MDERKCVSYKWNNYLNSYLGWIKKNALYFIEPAPYYGTLIGKLSNKEEGISGRIYAVDKNTVFIRNFTYTGDNSRKWLLCITKR